MKPEESLRHNIIISSSHLGHFKSFPFYSIEVMVEKRYLTSYVRYVHIPQDDILYRLKQDIYLLHPCKK